MNKFLSEILHTCVYFFEEGKKGAKKKECIFNSYIVALYQRLPEFKEHGRKIKLYIQNTLYCGTETTKQQEDNVIEHFLSFKTKLMHLTRCDVALHHLLL